MQWKIEVSPEARREFYSLPLEDRSRIKDKLRKYVKDKHLAKHTGNLTSQAPGWNSLRVGKFRVIFVLFKSGIETKEVHYGTMRIFAVCKRKCLSRILAKRYQKYG
jgi:mRNA-degrading endonuclease RelE of RelBE toxin-antitoxin system